MKHCNACLGLSSTHWVINSKTVFLWVGTTRHSNAHISRLMTKNTHEIVKFAWCHIAPVDHIFSPFSGYGDLIKMLLPVLSALWRTGDLYSVPCLCSMSAVIGSSTSAPQPNDPMLGFSSRGWVGGWVCECMTILEIKKKLEMREERG